MRCYLVDELQPEVIANLEAQLTKNGCQSGIERLYWLPLEKERLLPVQREHESSCGPHCLALEILDDGSGNRTRAHPTVSEPVFLFSYTQDRQKGLPTFPWGGLSINKLSEGG